MAIAYPLDIPTALKFSETAWEAGTVVGVARSPFTFQAQKHVWPGQAWMFEGTTPPIPNTALADDCIAFLLSLNGPQGTFKMGDRVRRNTRGTAAGAWTVGAGQAALATTLTIAGGTGAFAKGDWLQISTYLYRVIKIVDATHVDVWPRTRAAHANGTAIVYTDPVGIFMLQEEQRARWSISTAKKYGIQVRAIEDI